MTSEIYAVIFPIIMFADIPISIASIAEYPFRWFCMAFYLGTALWTAWEAGRLGFFRYQLDAVIDAPAAFFGTFFFWPYFFYCFLRNRKIVLAGKAKPRTEYNYAAESVRPTIGAWYIAWFILFLIFSFPNPTPSRILANQATAAIALKNYLDAQEIYNARYSNGYCDNFRNLYYGIDNEGQPLGLISQAHADAFATPPAGSPTYGEAPSTSTPYQGYVFYEDPYVAENKLWKETYAIVASPIKPGETGQYLYWIGKEEKLYIHRLPDGREDLRLIAPEESPLHPQSALRWIEM